jgi:hypothetical protein
MKAGEVVSLDIRLPVEALNMGINSEKQPVPFSWLIAVVDSREELQETKVDNNFAILARLDIPVVEVGK